MMALTFRRADARRGKRTAHVVVAIGALWGLLIGVAVVAAFPDAHAYALDAAGARTSPQTSTPAVTTGSIHAVRQRTSTALRHDPADRREDRKAHDRLQRDVMSP